jgi:hypothetical protein
MSLFQGGYRCSNRQRPPCYLLSLYSVPGTALGTLCAFCAFKFNWTQALLFLFYRWRNRGSEIIRKLTDVAQLWVVGLELTFCPRLFVSCSLYSFLYHNIVENPCFYICLPHDPIYSAVSPRPRLDQVFRRSLWRLSESKWSHLCQP